MANWTARILFFCLLLGASSPIMGQRLSLGAVAGTTYSKLANLDNRRKISASSGLFLMYRLHDNWSLQQEARYLSAGGRMGYQGVRFTFRNDYAESTTLLNYIFEGQYFHWQAQTGIALGYNTLATFDRYYNARPFVRTWDYSWVIGIGFRRMMGNSQWLHMSLRHRFGRPAVFTNAAFRVPNSIFSLDIGYSFALLMRHRNWR
jgi:hypothetical protein